MTLEFSRLIFEEYANKLPNFMKIRPVGAEFRAGGQTDVTELIVPFRNFANAPINPAIGSTNIDRINLAVLPLSFKTNICFYSLKRDTIS